VKGGKAKVGPKPVEVRKTPGNGTQEQSAERKTWRKNHTTQKHNRFRNKTAKEWVLRRGVKKKRGENGISPNKKIEQKET